MNRQVKTAQHARITQQGTINETVTIELNVAELIEDIPFTADFRVSITDPDEETGWGDNCEIHLADAAAFVMIHKAALLDKIGKRVIEEIERLIDHAEEIVDTARAQAEGGGGNDE